MTFMRARKVVKVSMEAEFYALDKTLNPRLKSISLCDFLA